MNKKQLAAVEKLRAKLDVDPGHSAQVAKLSLALFDALRELHGLGEGPRGLLHAAALLHDVGYSKGAQGHHKASRDLILESDLPFLEQEMMVIACIARYHRKGLPDERHKLYRALQWEVREVVDRLSALVRIADGLDRLHMSSVQSLRVEVEPDVVRVVVQQSPQAPDDLDAAMKKSDLFEKVFGRRVQVVCGENI